MFLIRCPHCAETREEEEFAPAGEAWIARPADPEAASDAQWGHYLFMRRNPKGWHWELWQHAAGCRKFFVARRHTVSHAIEGTWTLAEGRAVFRREEEDR